MHKSSPASHSNHGHRGFAGSSVVLLFGGLPLVGVGPTWEGHCCTVFSLILLFP